MKVPRRVSNLNLRGVLHSHLSQSRSSRTRSNSELPHTHSSCALTRHRPRHLSTATGSTAVVVHMKPLCMRRATHTQTPLLPCSARPNSPPSTTLSEPRRQTNRGRCPPNPHLRSRSPQTGGLIHTRYPGACRLAAIAAATPPRLAAHTLTLPSPHPVAAAAMACMAYHP